MVSTFLEIIPFSRGNSASERIRSASAALGPLLITVLYSFLAWRFMRSGRDFAVLLPKPIWALLFGLNILAVLRLPRAVKPWGLALCGALALSLLVDLTRGSLHDSFAQKAAQRFLGYTFLFLPVWIGNLMPTEFLGREGLKTSLKAILGICIANELLAPFKVTASAFQSSWYPTLLVYLAIAAVVYEKRLARHWKMVGVFFCTLLLSTKICLDGNRTLFLSLCVTLTWMAWRLKATLPKIWMPVFLAGSLGLYISQQHLTDAGLSRRFFATVHTITPENISNVLEKNKPAVVMSNVDHLGAAPNIWWRYYVWRDALDELTKSPILGIGYKQVFSSKRIPELLPEAKDSAYDVDLHNSWLQVFLRGGSLTGIAFLLFCLSIFFKSSSPLQQALLLQFSIHSLANVTFETPFIAIPYYGIFVLIGLFHHKAEENAAHQAVHPPSTAMT